MLENRQVWIGMLLERTVTDLAATLTELDTWLQEFAPDVLEELAEPASAELLAKLTESYSAPIPEDGAYMEAMLEACRDGVLVYDQDEGFATDDNQSTWQEFLSANLSGTMQQP